MPFKYGKKQKKWFDKLPIMGSFVDVTKAYPSVPAGGLEFAVPTDKLSVLGNDVYGCCAPAGFLHFLQALSYNTGSTPYDPTVDDCLGLYSAVTGFNINAGPPDNNPTDQGTSLTDLLTFAMKTGVTITNADGTKSVHKILGYAALDISSIAQTRWATHTFGGSYMGINCPEACQQNTSNWDFGPGSPIDGGHCIFREGQGDAGGNVDSWGLKIPCSNLFLQSYRDEDYIIVTEDWLDKNTQKSPFGLDISSLMAAMKLI